ncbi:Asp23/Gls24 family envelope stress response protein [Gordonia sputi]
MADAVTVTRGDLGASAVGTAAPALSPEAADASDPGARGSLVLDDRVGEKIAERAALGVDGVIESDGKGASVLNALNPLSGGYPSASTDMSQTAPTITLTVALLWPCAVAAVCAEVRDHVAAEVTRLTGVRPGRVDVTVAEIVTTAQAKSRRAGFVEIPNPTTPSEVSEESPEGRDTRGERVTDSDEEES